MASRHSVTVQLADSALGDRSPGHGAVVINTPEGQTYAGLGPASHNWQSYFGGYSPPSFHPQTVPPGTTPPDASNPQNYSTVSGHNSYKTFTIPISESEAANALAEIKRMEASGEYYNLLNLVNGNYCIPALNRILQAAGLGNDILHRVPNRAREYLSDIEKTLLLNPKAKFMIDGPGLPTRIPDSLRGIQQDYAYVGGGYDTPSERTRRVVSRREDTTPAVEDIWRNGTAPTEFLPSANVEASDNRSRGWSASVPGITPRDPAVSPAPAGRPLGIVTGERLPQWVTPPPFFDFSDRSGALSSVGGRGRPSPQGDKPASVFETGAPAVPFVPSSEHPPPVGGIAKWIADLAGIDPRYPDQFAPPPADDELRAFYKDDPAQPWFIRAR